MRIGAELILIFQHMLRHLCLATVSLFAFGEVSFAQNANASSKPAVAQEKAPAHPDRVIVQFKADLNDEAKEAAHGKADTRPHKKMKKAPGLEVRLLNGRKNLGETIAAYQASGLVEFAEPDYRVRA